MEGLRGLASESLSASAKSGRERLILLGEEPGLPEGGWQALEICWPRGLYLVRAGSADACLPEAENEAFGPQERQKKRQRLTGPSESLWGASVHACKACLETARSRRDREG